MSTDIAAPKRSVNTINTPIALNAACEADAAWLVSLYIATTGRTSKTKMTTVIIRFVSVSTLFEEKYQISDDVFARSSGVKNNFYSCMLISAGIQVSLFHYAYPRDSSR